MLKANCFLGAILGCFLSGYLLFGSNILLFVSLFILFLIVPIFFKQYQYCLIAFVFIISAFYQSSYETNKSNAALRFINSNPEKIVGTITGNVSKYDELSYFYFNLDNGIKAYVKYRGNETLYPGFRLEMKKADISSVNIHNKIGPTNLKLLGNNAFLSITCDRENTNKLDFNKWYYLQYYGKLLRENSSIILEKYLDTEEAGVCNAMLSSEKNDISAEFNEALIVTGTIHIIVVSGMHFTLLFAILFVFFSLFIKSRRKKLILILPFLIFYVFFTGATLPVLRAFFMTAIILFLDLFYLKKADAKNLVLAIGVIFLGITPTLIYSPSFLLSFGAVLGLVFYNTYFSGRLYFIFHYMKEYLAAFFSAQIFTYPIIYYFFGRISTIAILSNLLVAPTVGIIIILAIALIVASFINFYLATAIGFVLNLVAKYFIFVVHYTANLNFGNPNFSINVVTVIALCSLGISIYYFLILKIKRYKLFIAIVSVILIMISVGSVLFPPNYLENKLVITFIGVKNTNSAIIQTPSSNFVLYGSLEDIYYNIKSSQIKKNSSIPLIILDDIKEFKFLYELVDLYKIENIIMPSKYAENYPDLFNIKYVDTNIRSSFDHIDVKINAEGWGIEEVSFKFCDSIVSFSNDNQYITNNILNSNENKTVIINSKYKTKEFDKISKSDFSGNNKLYSKKYYNDKIKAYTNFSMIEITDKGIEFFK